MSVNIGEEYIPVIMEQFGIVKNPKSIMTEVSIISAVWIVIRSAGNNTKAKYNFHPTPIKSKRWRILSSYTVLHDAETGLLQNRRDLTFLHNDTPPTIIKIKE